jgi:hypothetical protein
MSQLLQLIRDQRIIRQQAPEAVFFMSWKRPDNRPGQALGLKQDADESDEKFLDRLHNEAIRTGVRFVFIDYLGRRRQ